MALQNKQDRSISFCLKIHSHFSSVEGASFLPFYPNFIHCFRKNWSL